MASTETKQLFVYIIVIYIIIYIASHLHTRSSLSKQCTCIW